MSRLLNFIQSHLLPKQVSLLQTSSFIISELPLKSKFIKDFFSKKTLLLLMECKLLYLTMPSRQLVIICSYLCMWECSEERPSLLIIWRIAKLSTFDGNLSSFFWAPLRLIHWKYLTLNSTLMYLLGSVCCQQIHRSRIWLWVLICTLL